LITGEFEKALDFGGGALISKGYEDIFTAKFDPDGTHIWSRRFGDRDNQFAWDIDVDAAGNTAVTGYFSGTVNFGGGALVSQGDVDIFTAIFDPGGRHLRSGSFGGAGWQRSYGVASDAWGNVIITGTFENSVNFGGDDLSQAGGYDIFIAKFRCN
jgi:hypothetical protein